MKGRGAGDNPTNRFESLHIEFEPGEAPEKVATQYLRDDSQSVISRNSSPDLSFDRSLNPYRGCEHGCAYCYARPTHEYLGYSAGVDFETRILVKENAPELLARELRKKSYQPATLVMSGVTDPYQPIEKKLEITRRCLEVLAEFRHPVGIITKNHLVLRDLDHLTELAKYEAAHVFVSITSLDPALARKLEPRASSPRDRLEAIRELRAAGVSVSLACAPMIPGLNDTEIPAIVEAAAEAGAEAAFSSVVRLPGAVEQVFTEWVGREFPGRAEMVLGRIRETHGGSLGATKFGDRLTGQGTLAAQIRQLFRVSRKRAGLSSRVETLSTQHFRKVDPGQRELF